MSAPDLDHRISEWLAFATHVGWIKDDQDRQRFVETIRKEGVYRVSLACFLGWDIWEEKHCQRSMHTIATSWLVTHKEDQCEDCGWRDHG